MDIRSKENKERKRLESLNARIKELGLENLSSEERKQVKSILYNLCGTGLIAFGCNAEDDAKISLLQSIVEQNWLIIKKLDQLCKR